MTLHEIVLIPGDGIGLETSAAMCDVVSASGASINWIIEEAGAGCISEYSTPLPDKTLQAVKDYGCAIKGPVTTPVGSGFRSVNVALRKELCLYANVRPVTSIPGAGGRYDDIDLVIVRENTEDLYAGIEFEAHGDDTRDVIELFERVNRPKISDDSAISIKPISEHASRNIVEFAFDYAEKNERKRVTAVHKANIMKFTDGLFLQTARDVAEKYMKSGNSRISDTDSTQIEFNDMIVDAFCMNLVMNPSCFDVIVLPNLYGDIVSDLAAGMVGGLGLAPGANIGNSHAVFEAVHGSAPDIAGKDICNPTAQILSAAMMLDYLGESECSKRIKNAVYSVYRKGEHLTADIRRACKHNVDASSHAATCSEFTRTLIAEIENAS